MAQFQLFQDKAGEFRWRLRADNNQVVAQSSEGYTSKDDAQRGIEIIQETGLSSGPEIYQADGEFRFRIEAPNGNIIASGESYKNEADASHAVSLINQIAPKATVDDQT